MAPDMCRTSHAPINRRPKTPKRRTKRSGRRTPTGTRAKLAGEGWRPLHRELPDSDYRLHLRLNVDVDAAKIVAQIEDGILELSLPKAEAVKPRKIKVS